MSDLSFESFYEEWIAEVSAGSPSSVEKGRRFANKLVSHWLDEAPEDGDVVYCDGAGDGGIDIAVLVRGDLAEDGSAAEGDTWYLVQSKYGAALAGTGTILGEGHKVVETLCGHRPKLSSLAEGLLQRLAVFRECMSAQDRVVLVMGTDRPLKDEERRALLSVRAFGKDRLGPWFDVDEVSVETVYQRQLDGEQQGIEVLIEGHFSRADENLLVGAVPLMALFGFLREYQSATRDLDRLYDRNVRQFLGGKKKINRGIQATLLQSPEHFGLYNNGITIVVNDFEEQDRGWTLKDPSVVNGCQTTRSIWDVLNTRLGSGGTGIGTTRDAWTERLARGVVVAKIVRVVPGSEATIKEITRYTNSQNAVREKDFIALEQDFHGWQRAMADTHGLYLEIQRGGWDSRSARQKQHPHERQFTAWANAFDLLKVFGAGWLGEPGTAYGRNHAFVPEGSIFKRIMETDADTGEGFGLDDLLAAYKVQCVADRIGFGRGTERLSRRQSRFLFYFVFIDLVRDVARFAGTGLVRKADVTRAVLVLSRDPSLLSEVGDEAAQAIDEYLTNGGQDKDTVFDEPTFSSVFNNDLNAFLKSERLGKDDESSPRLRALVSFTRKSMGRSAHGRASLRDRASSAVSAAAGT